VRIEADEELAESTSVANAQGARRLGRDPRSCNWIDHGTLPAVRVGRAFRVRRQDVDALLERAGADSASLATRRSLWEPTTTTLPHRRGPAGPRSIWDDTTDAVSAVKRP
jgi:hypothetical protein